MKNRNQYQEKMDEILRTPEKTVRRKQTEQENDRFRDLSYAKKKISRKLTQRIKT